MRNGCTKARPYSETTESWIFNPGLMPWMTWALLRSIHPCGCIGPFAQPLRIRQQRGYFNFSLPQLLQCMKHPTNAITRMRGNHAAAECKTFTALRCAFKKGGDIRHRRHGCLEVGARISPSAGVVRCPFQFGSRGLADDRQVRKLSRCMESFQAQMRIGGQKLSCRFLQFIARTPTAMSSTAGPCRRLLPLYFEGAMGASPIPECVACYAISGSYSFI